jgi:hypothetical protein
VSSGLSLLLLQNITTFITDRCLVSSLKWTTYAVIIRETRGSKRKSVGEPPEPTTPRRRMANRTRNAVAVPGDEARPADLNAVWNDLRSGIQQIYQKNETMNMSKNRYMELYT